MGRRHTNRLETKTHTGPCISWNRSKSIFKIMVTEEILCGSKHPKAELVFFDRERISGGKIDAAISVKAIYVGVEG